MSRILRLMLALLLMGVAARPCTASSYLSRLEKTRGKEVRWHANWSADKRDHNVVYQIVGVKVENKIPLRSVTLELRTKDSASRRERSVTAEAEDTARSILERLVEQRDKLRFPDSHPSPVRAIDEKEQSSTYLNSDDLPFIRYSNEGWVRDYRPKNERLVTCQVGSLRYLCSDKEKQRFGGTLKRLETELRWLSRQQK